MLLFNIQILYGLKNLNLVNENFIFSIKILKNEYSIFNYKKYALKRKNQLNLTDIF